jgi:RHS repeat-associated protein
VEEAAPLVARSAANNRSKDPMRLGHPRLTAGQPQPLPCLDNLRLVGDPVDVVTGTNVDFTLEFRLHGPLPLLWGRCYDSARNILACPLGWGQTHDYDRTLTNDLEGLRYFDPLAGEVAFPPLEVGQRAPNAGMLLRRVTTSKYELARPDQPVEEFEFSAATDTTPLQRMRQGDAQIIFRYCADSRLCEIRDSLGRSIEVDWDSYGRILGLFLIDPYGSIRRRPMMIYEYDEAGNLVMARDMYNAILRFRWDQHNRMTCRTDRRGYSFHFEYDEHGRCVHSRGDDGLFEVFLDYNPDFKTTFVRRGDGGQWTYFYDAAGTVMQITDSYGGATSFIPDETGRITEEIDPKGNVTKHHYSSTGQHDYRIDPNGNVLPAAGVDSDFAHPLAYHLADTPLEWEFGNLVARDTIELPESGDVVLNLFPSSVRTAVLGGTHAERSTASFYSDDVHELEQTVDPERPLEHGGPSFAQRWKYDPNGNLIEHQDRDGSTWRAIFGSWNALREQIDPLGQVTRFEHTVQGVVARVIDPGGTVTEYDYDLKERLLEVRQHSGNRETYIHDHAGNIVEKKGTRGRTLVSWKIGPGNLDTVRIQASGEKHLFEHDERGRLIKAETPAGLSTFSYDDYGHILADQHEGKGVAHEFDSGQLVSTTLFEKFAVTYAIDENRNLVIKDPAGAEHHFKFSESGLIAKLFANGVKEFCQFDAKGRCLRKVLVRSMFDAAPWIREYGYSAVGDLIECRDTERGLTKYSYDAAHRLASDLTPDGTTRLFTFDAAGNLCAQPGLAGVVIDTGNRLTAANGERLVYNDRDHLSLRTGPRGAASYQYNDLDMLVRCDINGEVWTASYDAYCRRIQKTWGARTTTYYWDDFRLAAELRHDGSVRIYVYADEVALVPFLFVEYASLDAEPGSGKRYYIFANQIGAPIRVEDDSGRSCWSALIDPYGVAHVGPGSNLEMPLRFPGHYHDPETGLHCNRFRYYSPELGRYLQSDPAGQEGGINVYIYPVNPLVGADIDGLRGGGGGQRAGRKGKSGPAGANARCPLGGTHSSQRMVDQMIRDGHIVIQGDKKYKNAVKGDLYRIASSQTGRNTLNTIRNSGQPTTIKNWDPSRPGNGCAGGTLPGASPPPHGTGNGAPSTVFYNPHQTGRPAGSPPDAGLNHELGHAAHNATGTNARNDPPPDPPTIKNTPNAEEHNTTANEDNAYRAERNLPQRDNYKTLP